MFIRSGLDPERLIVLPNFADDPGPRTRAAANSRTVLFVGRLSREKGIDRFLEYWKGADPDLQLVVAGDGPLSAELRSGHPKIDFRGRLDPEQVSELMLEARALVFPSTWYEGQSLVLLEAMAAGLPVISSFHAGIPSVVENEITGLLVPEKDAKALEAAMLRLATDTVLRARIGRQGQQYALEQLDVSFKEKELEEIYDLISKTKKSINTVGDF